MTTITNSSRRREEETKKKEDDTNKKVDKFLYLPLSTLFEKPQIYSPKVSSNGTFIVWLERTTENGILNFFISSSPTTNNNNNKFQLSFFQDRDACIHYEIITTTQQNTLLFLRESQLGKEMYHLYTLPIPMTVLHSTTKDKHSSCHWNSSNWKYTNHTELLSNTTIQTCCIGFVGSIQLWTSNNNKVRFATGTGMTFIWDISELDIQTGHIHIVHYHPLSSSNKSKLLLILSYLQVLLGTLLHLFTSYFYLLLHYCLLGHHYNNNNDDNLKKWIVTSLYI